MRLTIFLALLCNLAFAANITFIGGSGGGGGGNINSINGDTTANQLLVAGTAGANFTITTSSGTTTFNLPDASATARGVITTGAQTIAGAKTFSSTLKTGGSFACNRVVTGDVDAVIAANECIHGVSALTTTRTLTLPAASSVSSGQFVTVKDEGGAVYDHDSGLYIAVAAAGADTINELTAVNIVSRYGSRTFYSNGSNKWYTKDFDGTTGKISIDGVPLVNNGTPFADILGWASIQGTFPDLAETFAGQNMNIGTTVGTNPQFVTGLNLGLGAGYTGTAPTASIWSVSSVEGTAPLDLWDPVGNFGVMAGQWASSQEKAGSYGYAFAGSRAVGSAGVSVGQDATGTSIGVYGGAQVPATGIGTGGYFKIGDVAGGPTDIPLLPFSPVSGAIVADNGDTVNDIAVFQDNAVTKVRIKDKGLVQQTVTLATGEVAHTTTATPPSSGTTIKAVEGIIAAGYTGNQGIRAGNFVNLSPSTGYDLGNVYGSYGVRGAALSDNTSKNIAVDGEAASGNVNIGVVGHVLNGDPGVSTNIGVMGLARRDGLNNVAIYGKLSSTLGPLLSPTPTGESVLFLDNGNSNAQIAVFQANGVTVGSMNESGKFILGTEITATKTLSVASGTLTAGVPSAVSMSAVLPNAGGYYHIQNLSMDTTGVSAAAEIAGILLTINAGYTGTAATFAIAAENDAAGVGATVFDSFYNAGGSFAAGAVGTEHIGVAGEAFQGTKLWGTTGFAYAGTISNTGVYGAARQTGSIAAGGYFKISNTQSHLGSQLTPPVSAALLADNDDTNADVLNLQVGGSTVYRVTADPYIVFNSTFPNSVGTHRGMDYVFNSTAGSNPGQLIGMRILMNSNSTPLTTAALFADNNLAGTQGVGLSSPTGNFGFSVSSGAAATEHVGIYGEAYAGSKTWGVTGASVGTDTGGVGVGVYGGAQVVTAGGAAGGLFKIHTSAGTVLDPNAVQNGAIVADNGDTSFVIANFLKAASSVSFVDVNGNFATNLAGVGFRIKEGSNARMGVNTLSAGTVTVSNTSVTANTRIFLTCQDPNGGVPGAEYVSARTASTSFVITSTSVADTCIVAWELIEPTP